MLNIVIFGAPGSGKGTQSERIVEKYGINHISTGDVLRAEIKNGTELGKTAKGYIDQGQLIPDELMIDILASVFDSFKDSKGVIFDGFPRTIAQAEALKKMLAERGQDVSVMLDLDVPEDELMVRLIKRGKDSGRADDNEETIKKRLHVYHSQTAPLIDWYKNEKKYQHINGLGTMEGIFADICGAVDGLIVFFKYKSLDHDYIINQSMAESNFVDYVKIYCRSGKGGRGSTHMRREKYCPNGGPDGGDGGRGGHIILRGNRNYWTLLHLKFDRHAMAGHGESGSKGRSFGKDGEDKIIEVPCGTVVYNAETGEYICDVTEDGQEVILLKGGRGGQGNWHFKTATRQAPRFAQPGEPMQEMTVIMELKLLADVGLVGFPNAGKSTLLSSISAAKPKIADYPFTTLEPNLGIVSYHDGKSFVMADIPGIIEGASQGKGLGLRFLRHIERNSLLLFMVPADSDDIRKEYDILLNELRTFNPEMLDKQRVLAITKSDMLDQELMDEIEPTLPEGIPHVFISSVSGLGISVLKNILWEELNKESNKIEAIVHRPKDVTCLQQELKDMGEDEDIVYEYEEDADDDEDIDYEYEEEDWEEK